MATTGTWLKREKSDWKGEIDKRVRVSERVRERESEILTRKFVG
jgi:hypothetical protein